MIVLDANVLIAYLDNTDAHHSSALAILDAHASSGFAASALTVAETLVHPCRAGRGADASDALDEIGLRRIEFSATDTLPLAAIRASTDLRLPDAVVLLVARDNGVALATFDARLGVAARSAGLDVFGG